MEEVQGWVTTRGMVIIPTPNWVSPELGVLPGCNMRAVRADDLSVTVRPGKHRSPGCKSINFTK